MRLLTFILCFLLSISAFAQGGDTVREDTSKPFMIIDGKSVTKHNKPLILIDGIIYNGDLKKINPDDILRVDVLKPPRSTNIYGKQGANGVILITTKTRQNIDAINKSDTVVSTFPDSAIYVIDGEISDKKLNGINPKNILSIDILKKDKASEIFEGDFRNGVVIVVTKSSATISYQKKLSTFSEKYKKYLQENQNDDKELIYILNGVPIDRKNNDEAIEILYKIHIEDIKTVKYADNFIEGMRKGATIFIATKQ